MAIPNPVICLGHVSLDHHFGIDTFPDHPTKTPASSYRSIVGGMGANAAIAAHKLGGQVRLAGRVGDDAAGGFVRNELSALGIDPGWVEVVSGTQTSVSTVIVDGNGERQIFNHRGDALGRAHALHVNQLAGARAILVDPRWVAGAQAALRWARENAVLHLLDADVAPQADLQLLVPLAQWAVFSEPGLRAYAPDLTRDDALQLALRSGAEVAMVTLGEHGVRWADGAGVHQLPGFAVKALDTTGAGDVFHAALMLALAEGQPQVPAIRFACAAAALKCERRHGVMETPTREEVDHFMRKNGQSPT